MKTDLFLAIPPDHYGRIAGRSDFALKDEIGVGAGVIGSDFRGIVAVVLFNQSKSPYEVNIGDRIAQMIFEKYETVRFVELANREKLPKTEKDSDGFGSSGVSHCKIIVCDHF